MGLLAIGIAQAQEVNMDRYMTLSVQKGGRILLRLAADANNTPIKIVSGDTTYNISVDTSWTTGGYESSYFSMADTMKVYGNILRADCSFNNSRIKAIDVSHNTYLQTLYCIRNKIHDLDISKNIALRELMCNDNQINSLDVSKNTALIILCCNGNQISSIDVSQLHALELFDCYENLLTSLDVSQNTNLKYLWCFNNQLDSLNISKNTALTELLCYNNSFSTQALDLLYCSLPNRDSISFGVIYPLNNTEDSSYTNAIATNTQNAIDKNWRVWYYDDYSGSLHNKDIPTNGTYDCSVGIEEPTAYKHMTIYPNPVADVLHIDTPGNIIEVQIYNISGALVSTTKNSKHISAAHLPKGVYTLKAITAQGAYNQKIVKE